MTPCYQKAATSPLYTMTMSAPSLYSTLKKRIRGFTPAQLGILLEVLPARLNLLYTQVKLHISLQRYLQWHKILIIGDEYVINANRKTESIYHTVICKCLGIPGQVARLVDFLRKTMWTQNLHGKKQLRHVSCTVTLYLLILTVWRKPALNVAGAEVLAAFQSVPLAKFISSKCFLYPAKNLSIFALGTFSLSLTEYFKLRNILRSSRICYIFEVFRSGNVK